MKKWIQKFKTEHESLFQLISFALLGAVAGAAELGSFALFRWLVFRGLESVSVRWWIFDYGPDNGGLCYFISICLSFLCGQAVNYVVQRKFTFEANNDVKKSVAQYSVMIAAMWFLQMWLPTVVRAPIVSAVGAGLGDVIVKMLCMFSGFLISFPMSKFVIMKKEPEQPK